MPINWKGEEVLLMKKSKDHLNEYRLIRIVCRKKNTNMGFSVPLLEKLTFSCKWRTLSLMKECSSSRISNSNPIPLKVWQKHLENHMHKQISELGHYCWASLWVSLCLCFSSSIAAIVSIIDVCSSEA